MPSYLDKYFQQQHVPSLVSILNILDIMEHSMDCVVHGVAKSWTQLSDFHFQEGETVLKQDTLFLYNP